MLRPDLCVHALCENAGSAKDAFKLAMGRATGMDDVTTDLIILASDRSKWTAMPRLRTLLSILPCISGPLPPERAWP
eukprot:11176527-Lingulodinium_polyedra.AAC.1